MLITMNENNTRTTTRTSKNFTNAAKALPIAFILSEMLSFTAANDNDTPSTGAWYSSRFIMPGLATLAGLGLVFIIGGIIMTINDCRRGEESSCRKLGRNIVNFFLCARRPSAEEPITEVLLGNKPCNLAQKTSQVIKRNLF